MEFHLFDDRASSAKRDEIDISSPDVFERRRPRNECRLKITFLLMIGWFLQKQPRFEAILHSDDATTKQGWGRSSWRCMEVPPSFCSSIWKIRRSYMEIIDSLKRLLKRLELTVVIELSHLHLAMITRGQRKAENTSVRQAALEKWPCLGHTASDKAALTWTSSFGSGKWPLTWTSSLAYKPDNQPLTKQPWLGRVALARASRHWQ